MAFVEFHKVKKTYHTGEISIDALRDVNFQVGEGRILRCSRCFPEPEKRPSSIFWEAWTV